MHATEYYASKQKYIVLRKTFSASDSSLLSSFYVRNQITHTRTWIVPHIEKKKERKQLSDKALYIFTKLLKLF